MLKMPFITKALLGGGINVIELTLRTDCALEAVGMKSFLRLFSVSAILTPEQAVQIKQAGAHFGVSPG